MASNDPGLAQMGANAEDPAKGDIKKDRDGSMVEENRPVAPDQFDEKYQTSKWEIWAYYSYYIGNNGLTLFNFAPTAAQNLVYERAVVVGGKNNDVLHFMGADRQINAIILLCNGISFAIQAVLFLILGSYADFGSFRPNILIALSIVAWGLGFGWLGVHHEEQVCF
jgi:MFS-type transporter involved in bile tolerance (Atg22 family)